MCVYVYMYVDIYIYMYLICNDTFSPASFQIYLMVVSQLLSHGLRELP